MEILAYVSGNKIAQLIDLEGLVEQKNCSKDEIKMSNNFLRFKVNLNPYFTYFEIEGNSDETFTMKDERAWI